jgi:hypothetical protein
MMKDTTPKQFKLRLRDIYVELSAVCDSNYLLAVYPIIEGKILDSSIVYEITEDVPNKEIFNDKIFKNSIVANETEVASEYILLDGAITINSLYVYCSYRYHVRRTSNGLLDMYDFRHEWDGDKEKFGITRHLIENYEISASDTIKYTDEEKHNE